SHERVISGCHRKMARTGEYQLHGGSGPTLSLMHSLRISFGAALLALSFAWPASTAAPLARNVVIVTIDGFRWQEGFGGANRDYFKKTPDGKPSEAETRFWRDGERARRDALLPFLWNTIAKDGVVLGDPAKHSRVHLTNGLWFSYPGYSEMLTGIADPRIDSN